MVQLPMKIWESEFMFTFEFLHSSTQICSVRLMVLKLTQAINM